MTTNPISCEPCRQKKCKCDRLLPICTQCTSTSTQNKCVYPESGKRLHNASRAQTCRDRGSAVLGSGADEAGRERVC
ncbi:hypothetical protein BDV25DRAFT_62395 [Aspergillus avenaceus]|uniref:Zn(2)-C6 fungal-type domain-containing protein n=1 Tax=Aspergillus avenaceus TaxID=36643 RepID=A0A5N6THM4_ASPAV|nr:hypothetical protein BDV25DRAFT_62395 [Aspergillus avenaceus]